MLILLILVSCTEKNFDSKKWKTWDVTNSDYISRWDMVDDLIENYNLKGKTKIQIEEILGKPLQEEPNSSEIYSYDLGPCGRGIDFGSLHIFFRNGKVRKVEKSCS